MVDRLLVERKISQLDNYLSQIKEFSVISFKEYESDWKIQRIVERTLHLLIETCFDIANQIISDEGFRIPETYADTFVVLFENNVIDENLSKNMQKMAKFRNILVHHYEKIDPAIIISILGKNLEDFEEFKKSILIYLNK